MPWPWMWLIYYAQWILKNINGEDVRTFDFGILAGSKWAVMCKQHCVSCEKSWKGL